MAFEQHKDSGSHPLPILHTLPNPVQKAIRSHLGRHLAATASVTPTDKKGGKTRARTPGTRYGELETSPTSSQASNREKGDPTTKLFTDDMEHDEPTAGAPSSV
mmetsp:Transcript_28084/g.38831  ORF Transcript_28084/g.38831 Transcript_28084/m.38831 type:complete len:104 (-) Transcript_28084:137-448(-)